MSVLELILAVLALLGLFVFSPEFDFSFECIAVIDNYIVYDFEKNHILNNLMVNN